MGNCSSSGATKTKKNRPNPHKRGLDDTKHPKNEKFDDDDDEDEEGSDDGKRGLDDTKHPKTKTAANAKPKKSLDEINAQYKDNLAPAKNKV